MLAIVLMCCVQILVALSQFQRQIKVGLMFSNNPPYDKFFGYYSTVGALNIAMDHIAKDGLIPQFNFTFYTKFDECNEALAAGNAAEFLENTQVDVIIGPSCSYPALIVGSFASFYNVPMVNYGSTAALDLANATKFPTTFGIVGPTLTVAQAFVQIMLRFSWRGFAYLYDITDTKTCLGIRDDLLQVVSSPTVPVDLTYYKELNFKDDEQFNRTIDGIRGSARIIGFCADNDEYKRKVLVAFKKAGYIDDPTFVIIMVRFRGIMYDRSTSITRYNGTSIPLWESVDNNANTSAENEDVKAALQRTFILDLDRSGEDLNGNLALELSKGPPFYCSACTNIGLGAAGLGDALYMYALGLNKTLAKLTQNPLATNFLNLNLKLGRDIRNNLSNVTFKGLQGNLVMDQNTVRVNNFIFAGLSSSFVPTYYYKIHASMDNATMAPTNNSASTWWRWNGTVPLDSPICGFDGSFCPESILVTYGVLIYAVIAVTALSAIGTIGYLLRGRYLEYKRLNAAWQISIMELRTKVDKSESRSHYSNVSSIPSLLRKDETKHFTFYIYNGESVAARRFASKIRFDSIDRAQHRLMIQIDHDNLAKFLGICMDAPTFMSIWRFYHRGSITDIIATGSFAIDGVFMISLIRDIVNGLQYIHRSDIHYHGHFNSSNCLVDERWVCKIADYGLTSLFSIEPISQDKLLYMAPELLKKAHPLEESVNKSADIYSLAIVAAEIINRRPAWDTNTSGVKDVDEILYLLKKDRDIPIRPVLDTGSIEDLNSEVPVLIKTCWSDNPEQRPAINNIRQLLRSISTNKNESLMDHVFQVLEKYMNTLQEEVESRTKALVEEKKRSDVLLYRLLPRPIADKLKTGNVIEPESFDSVTVFFSDVVRFGELAAKSSPVQAITLLNDLFTMFDGVIETYDCYKVESVGDDTLVASGLPTRNGIAHVKEIARLSLAFMNGVAIFHIPHLPHEKVQLRIGFHSGSCVAGVVGLAMPRYCLFGDTINTASRMCSNSRPDRIHLSADANALLKLVGGFATRSRGELIIKGKGVMETFFLEGIDRGEEEEESPSNASTERIT